MAFGFVKDFVSMNEGGVDVVIVIVMMMMMMIPREGMKWDDAYVSCVSVYVCVYVHVYVHVCVCVYVCVCVCVVGES